MFLAATVRRGWVLQELPIVLVIEDDKDLQGMLEDGLRDGEFEPAIAASGEEAVTLLKAFRSNYSALVTDISLLGRMDGWRVARARQGRSIPRFRSSTSRAARGNDMGSERACRAASC